MNAWAYSARQWRKEAKRLRMLLRRGDEIIKTLQDRNNLVFADDEILAEFGMTELERYAQTSPAEMFRQLLAEEKANL